MSTQMNNGVFPIFCYGQIHTFAQHMTMAIEACIQKHCDGQFTLQYSFVQIHVKASSASKHMKLCQNMWPISYDSFFFSFLFPCAPWMNAKYWNRPQKYVFIRTVLSNCFFFEFLWLIDIFPMTYVCARFLCERKVSFAHVIQLCIFFGWFSIVLLLGLLLPSQCDICFVPLYL